MYMAPLPDKAVYRAYWRRKGIGYTGCMFEYHGFVCVDRATDDNLTVEELAEENKLALKTLGESIANDMEPVMVSLGCWHHISPQSVCVNFANTSSYDY